MKYELKRIAVFPVIKVTFLVSLVLGFLLGLLMALFMAPFMAMMSRVGSMQQQPFDFSGASIGALIIILPILYSIFLAIFNTIGAALAAMLYNFVVKFAGGLELDFEAAEGSAPAMPRPMDMPGAIYAQAAMTPRYAPPPQPPTFPTSTPPPPVPPTQPTDPQGDKNRPTQFPFE